ncbi:MAG: hypothetical protein QOF18_2633 [Frankiaceae bacterium]|jgi:hypothetical protein|nr:hypothetical protein [Frankiaceae bacterium]
MTARTITIAAATLAAGGAMLIPSAALAASGPHCDAYSKHCPQVKGHKIVRPPTQVKGEKSTLPFTGAEVVLMTVVGTGALGAGTVFVVAGRRRRHTAAA